MSPKILQNDEGRHLQVMTNSVRIKVSGADTEGRYAMGELNDPPGSGVPLHVHEREDETFHVLEGLFEFETGSERFTAGPGTIVHLPRGTPHGFRTSGAGRNRALVTTAPAGIETMFEELAALPPGPPDLERAGAICGRYGVRFL